MVDMSDQLGNKIKAKTMLKILGFTMISRASLENHLSKVKAKIGLELSKIKP